MAKKQTAGTEELIRVDGEIKKRRNRYYAKVSDRYKTLGFVIILTTVIVCGALLLKYGEYITYDNFVYMIRDFDSVSDKDDGFTEIKFEAQNSAVFKPFRDGVAVIGDNRVSLFDKTGVILCSEEESYSYPAGDAGEKYLITYDVGGYGYSIYNSVARVIRRECEFPIICASVSDDGAYAITTESQSSKYATEVYNSAFKHKMTVLRDQYVMDTAINRNGETVAVACISERGAEIVSEVAFHKMGETDALNTHVYSASLPLEVTALNNGVFCVLFDDAIRFYDENGALKTETAVNGEDITCFDAVSEGVVLVTRANTLGSKSRIQSFDTDGKTVYDGVIDGRVSDAAASFSDPDTAAILLSADRLCVLGMDSSVSEYPHDGGVRAVLDTGAGGIAMTADRGYRFTSDGDENDDGTEEESSAAADGTADETGSTDLREDK